MSACAENRCRNREVDRCTARADSDAETPAGSALMVRIASAILASTGAVPRPVAVSRMALGSISTAAPAVISAASSRCPVPMPPDDSRIRS